MEDSHVAEFKAIRMREGEREKESLGRRVQGHPHGIGSENPGHRVQCHLHGLGGGGGGGGVAMDRDQGHPHGLGALITEVKFIRMTWDYPHLLRWRGGGGGRGGILDTKPAM